MHANFKTAIIARSIEHALQHPELQDDPEDLACWARETFGVPLEKGADPMLTIAYQALARIAEAQRQQEQRSRPWKRKSEPDKKRPPLPWCWLANEETDGDQNQVNGLGTSVALLGTYPCRLPFLCHKECLERLEHTRFTSEIRLGGREGYTPCEGCGYPLAGPSATESWTHPPLFIPCDIAAIFYRMTSFPTSSISGGSESKGKHKSAPLQASLFDVNEEREGK